MLQMRQQLLIGFIATLLFAGFVVYVKNPAAFERYPIPEPMQAKVYYQVGQYYFNHDEDPGPPYDRDLARKYFLKAAELDPQADPALWYQLGRLSFLDGNLIVALQLFDKQLEYFDEDIPAVLYMQGLAYGYLGRRNNNPDDWRKAELAFINYLPYAPNAPWTRVDLAWIYFSQGKFAEMIPVLEEGLKTHADNPWLLNMYGLALLNTDKKEEALLQFTAAQREAARLTEIEWGENYPGNHPGDWRLGLNEFRSIIDKNIELAKSSSQ